VTTQEQQAPEREEVGDLERLVAIEEIKQVKARYFRGCDLRDWDLLASVFTDDARIDFQAAQAPELRARIGTSVAIGGKAAAEWISQAVAGSVTVHQGYMPEIDVVTPTYATAIWPMADHLWYEEGCGSAYREIDAIGHYHDEFVKRDGRWYLSSLRLTRLRSEETPW
jgi:hypothetical protein